MSVELEWPDGVEQISYEEFEQRVHDGEVPPDTPIRFEVVTGDAFVPAQELELFHTLADPDIRDFRLGLRSPGIPIVTAILVGLQLRFYFLAKLPGGSELMVEKWANWAPAILEGGEVYRLLSYGFLQIGFSHLLLNVLFLAYIGWNLERGMGRRNLLTLFVFSVFVGGAFSLLMTPGRPSLGSSGGDFGLLAAAVVFGWKHGDMIPSAARKFFGWGVLPYLVISLGMGLRSPAVDNWGHFGGLVGGGLLATLLEPDAYRVHRRSNRRTRGVSIAFMALVMAALVWKGPELLRTRASGELGLHNSVPASWSKEWTHGGEMGWRSPTGRATFVARTLEYGRPLSMDQAVEVVVNQLDAWGSTPEVVSEERLLVGSVDAVRLSVRFRESGSAERMEALVIPRGRFLHRLQLYSEENWAWRYRTLADKLFEDVRLVLPVELQSARRLASDSSRNSEVLVRLGDAASKVGYWEEARDAYRGARDLEDRDGAHARAAEGLLQLYRDAQMEATVGEMVDLASAHPEDVGVQIAAADLLDAHGQPETARAILKTVAQGNPQNFSLLRALRERGMELPELDDSSAPGHGESLP